MSDINRNPAVKYLKKLKPEEVMEFTMDQVSGKLGFVDLLTPQERVYCQDGLTLLQERLAWHQKMLQEKKARRSKMYDLPVSRYQLPTAKRPQKQMLITRAVEQSYIPKKQENLPDTKQPLQKTSNNRSIQSLESKKVEQSKQPAPLQSTVQSFDPSPAINNIHLRNPVVAALKKLTPEAIESFTRQQVVGKLGLNKLLTPLEQTYCQQQVVHLRLKLAEHDQLQRLQKLQEQARKTREREMESILFRRQFAAITKGQITAIHEKKIPIATQKQVPEIVQKQFPEIVKRKMPEIVKRKMPEIVEKQMPEIIEPTPTTQKQRLTASDSQMPTTTIVQRPSQTKNEPPKPTPKQPSINTIKNEIKEEQRNPSAVQSSWRFSSILEPFRSLLQKPLCFQSQGRKSSQELMELDDEQIELLINEGQKDKKEQGTHKLERKKRD